MFADDMASAEKSNKIANMLADHSFFKSHGRHIGREQAKKKYELKIRNLEDDQDLQDLVLSVFHSTTHTFNATPAVKIIENHLGKAFVKQSQQLVIPVPPPQTPTPPKGNTP